MNLVRFRADGVCVSAGCLSDHVWSKHEVELVSLVGLFLKGDDLHL